MDAELVMFSRYKGVSVNSSFLFFSFFFKQLIKKKKKTSHFAGPSAMELILRQRTISFKN